MSKSLCLGRGKCFVERALSAGSVLVCLWLAASLHAAPLLVIPNPSPSANDKFGEAVTVAGTKIVVGNPRDRSGKGSVFVFDDAHKAAPIRTLAHLDAGRNYGISVAGSGSNGVLVGESGANAAYLYNIDTGSTICAVTSPATTPLQFGRTVAASPTHLVVADPYETVGGKAGNGRVYMFSPDGTLEQTYDNPLPAVNAHFGASVAILGSYVAVGAPDLKTTDDLSTGMVFLFRTSGSAVDTQLDNPNTGTSNFGFSVALSTNRLYIGRPDATAFQQTPAATGGGQVFVYDTLVKDWVENVGNPTMESAGGFGMKVAAAPSNRVWIGDPLAYEGATAQAGKVYMFTEGDNSRYPLVHNISPTASSAGLGWSIAARNNEVIAGALGQTEGTMVAAGTVYVFPGLQDNWDPTDDDPSGATPLTMTLLSQSHGAHVLSYIDGSDWFQLDLRSGKHYGFTSPGSVGNITGELFESTNLIDPIAMDTDGGELSMEFVPAITGSYYLKTSALISEETPYSYTLSYIDKDHADLALEITPSVTSSFFGPRYPYQYYVVVKNFGPYDGTDVRLVDQLPDQTQFVSVVTEQGTCVNNPVNYVICDLGTVPAGDQTSLTITVVPTAAGTATNLGTVFGNDLDDTNNCTGINNCSQTTVELLTPPPDADLVVDMTSNQGVTPSGQYLSFTVNVTNRGPAAAEQVVLEDTLPAGLDFLSASATQGTWSVRNGILTANLGDLPIRARATLVLTLRPLGAGAATNAACTSSYTIDPTPDDGCASLTANVPSPGNADVSVTQTASGDPVATNSNLTFNVTVLNSGPDAASGVAVTDTIPSSVDFVSATPSQGTCSRSGTILTCSLGDVASGGTASVAVAVVPKQPGRITNAANVSSNDVDGVPTNNHSSLAVEVVDAASLSDVSATMAASPDPVDAGADLTYNITVANAGPAAASGVTVTDPLPDGVIFVSATSSQGAATYAAGVVTADLGGLASGGSAIVSVKVQPTQTGDLYNTATVTAMQPDPVSANNTAQAHVLVTGTSLAGADLTGAWISLNEQCTERRGRLTSKVRGSLHVENIGDGKARKSTAGVYVSTDPVLDEQDQLIKKIPVSRLKPGRGKNVNFTYTVPGHVPARGLHFIVVLDVKDVVKEIRESNNMLVSGRMP